MTSERSKITHERIVLNREVKQELDRIEQMRLRNQVRNEALLKRVHETMDESNNSSLMQAREQLEEAKRQFLRDLNKRDPTWRDKMRIRREDEVKRMEAQKDRLTKELIEKQKQMEADALLNERLRKMREKNDEQQE
jgi:hypothetical protein